MPWIYKLLKSLFGNGTNSWGVNNNSHQQIINNKNGNVTFNTGAQIIEPCEIRLSTLENITPKLLEEMQSDLGGNPMIRDVLLCPRPGLCHGSGFVYYYSDYPNLDALFYELEQYGCVVDKTPFAAKYTKKFMITEQFARMLMCKKYGN